MAEIEVRREIETGHGWSFVVAVRDAGGPATLHTVLLSWQDYERWAGGRLPPERIAAAVVRFLVDREGAAGLDEHFDASTARRRYPDIDGVIGASL